MPIILQSGSCRGAVLPAENATRSVMPRSPDDAATMRPREYSFENVEMRVDAEVTHRPADRSGPSDGSDRDAVIPADQSRQHVLVAQPPDMLLDVAHRAFGIRRNHLHVADVDPRSSRSFSAL